MNKVTFVGFSGGGCPNQHPLEPHLDQNIPGKFGESIPAGYTHGKVDQRSMKDQVEWLHLRTCLVAVLVWELS